MSSLAKNYETIASELANEGLIGIENHGHTIKYIYDNSLLTDNKILAYFDKYPIKKGAFNNNIVFFRSLIPKIFAFKLNKPINLVVDGDSFAVMGDVQLNMDFIDSHQQPDEQAFAEILNDLAKKGGRYRRRSCKRSRRGSRKKTRRRTRRGSRSRR
jgi:hypothetical protein